MENDKTEIDETGIRCLNPWKPNKQNELNEGVSEFLLNQNAKEKAEKIKKEIGGMLK